MTTAIKSKEFYSIVAEDGYEGIRLAHLIVLI